MTTNNATLDRLACNVTGMSGNSELDALREELKEQGHNYSEARKQFEQERGITKRRVVAALAAGLSESEVSKVTGIWRQTIRTWAGK